MDHRHFDALAKELATTALTRRQAVRRLGGLGIGVVLAGIGVGRTEAGPRLADLDDGQTPALGGSTTSMAASALRQCEFGPEQCIEGFVWRETIPTDRACVTPEVNAQVRIDNALRDARVDPTGAYGPASCALGYVWREATSGDRVCVTGEVKAQTEEDNALHEAGARLIPECQ